MAQHMGTAARSTSTFSFLVLRDDIFELLFHVRRGVSERNGHTTNRGPA